MIEHDIFVELRSVFLYARRTAPAYRRAQQKFGSVHGDIRFALFHGYRHAELEPFESEHYLRYVECERRVAVRPSVAIGIVHIDDYLLSVHIPMRIKRKTVGRERFSDEIIGFERRLRNFHTQNVRIKTRRQFVLIVAGNNPAAGTAASDPEALVIGREAREELLGRLTRLLSPFEGEVLSLFLDGCSYEEMAAKLLESDIDVVVTVPVLNLKGVKQQYCSDHMEMDWNICMKPRLRFLRSQPIQIQARRL